MPNKRGAIPRMYVRKGATLKEIYAQGRREFTAEDLQKYTEVEPTVPMQQVLEQMEKINATASKKSSTKPTQKR